MPDDPIQTNGAAPVEAAPAPVAAEPVAAPPVQNDSVSREEFNSVVSDLKSSLESVNTFFTTLRQESQRAPEPAPVSDDDFNTEFYNNPREAISSVFAEQALPIVAQNAKVTAQNAVHSHKAEIDSTYGEGTWDSIYEPRLGPVIDEALRTNPAMLLDTTSLDNAVKSISGDPGNMNKLFEMKANYSKSQQEMEQQNLEKTRDFVVNTTNMTGGLRRSSSGQPKLDDEQKAILKSMTAETGKPMNEARLATLMNSGNTIDEWAQTNEPTKPNGSAE